MSHCDVFFCNLLGTIVFLHADKHVSEFFRHTTQNGSKGAFSVLLRKVWLKGFRTVHNMVGSGGPKSALVAGGYLLFEARTWLGSGRLGQTDQTVSLFQCPFCSCVLRIVFSCFWTFIILCFFAGMGAHQMAAARKAAVLESLPRMPPSRVGHRRPDFKPVLPAPLPAVPPATGRRTLCPGTPS